MSNVVGAAGEPWQWDEPHWRGLVNQVRAGRRLAPARWKGGARCAVALSFDSDHETNELRDGGKSIGRMSWGQYGNRVGVPRILELMKAEGLNDVLVTVGGTIPAEDIEELKRLGVAEVFTPGASAEAAIDFIRSSVRP